MVYVFSSSGMGVLYHQRYGVHFQGFLHNFFDKALYNDHWSNFILSINSLISRNKFFLFAKRMQNLVYFDFRA